ncbi:MAG: TolC family protein [Cycloclasticus sp.]|jgi:outer membrane protein TolC|nr:TolC family protein [Cycloclasticus sp.]
MKLKMTMLIVGLCQSMLVFAQGEQETNIGHLHESPLIIAADLSLNEVVEKTFQRNPQLMVLQARLQHADALRNKAQSLWADDPSVTIGHYSDRVHASEGLQEWEAGVDFPIWLPGQREAWRQASERQRQLVGSSESSLKLHLAGIVREILWDISLRRNQVSVAEQEWNVVKKLEKDVKKRVELGDLARSDLILSQQESLSKEAAWRVAYQEYRHAQHRYDMVTGLSMLPKNIEEPVIKDLTINMDHPLLKESHDKVVKSTAERDLMIIEKRDNPSLFLGSRREKGASNEDYVDAIGISLNIPFGLESHSQPKLTKAEVSLSESRSQMEILHRELKMAIQDASRELSATTEQYGFAKRQNELSKKNLDMSRKAFALGETSLLELIRVQSQAFTIDRHMHQKHLEMGLQTARLNQAKGMIP